MDLGQKIKKLRLDKGMTLEQVGDAVGVGKSTVRKWETGEIANMGRDKIEKVAIALGVSPAYLMGWDDAEPVARRRTRRFMPVDNDRKVRVAQAWSKHSPNTVTIKGTTRQGVADLGEIKEVRLGFMSDSIRTPTFNGSLYSTSSTSSIDPDSETFEKFRKLDSYGKSVVRAVINLELNRVNAQNKEAHSNGMSEMQQDHT